MCVVKVIDVKFADSDQGIEIGARIIIKKRHRAGHTLLC